MGMNKDKYSEFGNWLRRVTALGIALAFTALTFAAACIPESSGSCSTSLDIAPLSMALSAGISPVTLSSEDNGPKPNSWAGDEYIISFDESGLYDAQSPDVAIAPPGSPWAGSMHCVWAEMNNSQDFAFSEIHYSKSEAWEAGRTWSNDEENEGDRLISQDFTGFNGANPGNATHPSITIDQMGWIHVVWVEQYPDYTYEIHYSRSINNGETWTGYDQQAAYGDILVSERSGQDGVWIKQPRVAVTASPLTVHVVWSEVSNTGEAENVIYVRSGNQGDTWTAELLINTPAAPGSPQPSDPDIATSGLNGEIVHIIWSQETEISPGVYAEDLYYARSFNSGVDWSAARAISQITPDTAVERPRLASVANNLVTVWTQYNYIMGSQPELFYSASDNNGDTWNGESADNIISFEDGQPAGSPAVSVYNGPGGTEAHVVWTEVDETNPLGSTEIHYSMSPTPMDPFSWTGRNSDIVLSMPDTAEKADAQNPSVAVGLIGGKVRPQIFWEELNVMDRGRAQQNTEIHYLPDQTFDIPVHLGWNLISVPLIQANTSISTVLDDSQGDGNTIWDIVKWYNPETVSDHWKTYRINGTNNDLSDLDNTMSFWINITALGDGNLTVYGDYGTSTQIPLKAGWNLVGYPGQTSKNISEALGGINDLPVEGYSSNSSCLIAQFTGSYMMKPGEGYWVHVTADTIWTVDW